MKDIDPDKDWESWFAERVDVNNDGCWVWRHGLSHDGYGRTKHYRNGKSYTWVAHRLMWTAVRGPIPEGLTVDHLCFNRACVNPDHLRLLTNEENASRQLKSLLNTCAHGHEYTPENTATRRNGDKWRRRCLTCLRAHDHKRRSAAA